MKKKLLLFGSILLLFLTSCSKDNDDSASSSSTIQGKWEYYKEGYIDNNTEVLTDYQNDCSNEKDYIEILSNGVIKTHIFEAPNTICEEAITTGNWSQNNTTFVITFNGETLSNEILELNNQNLKVKYFNDTNQQYELYVFKRI